MREIKFRAFLKKEKLMMHVKSIDFEAREVTLLTVAVNLSPNREMPADAIGECMHDQVQKFDDIILIPSTGRLDKDTDEEIYEGDIVEWLDSFSKPNMFIVKWDVAWARYNFPMRIELGELIPVKIIGNIHTDKEKMNDAST